MAVRASKESTRGGNLCPPLLLAASAAVILAPAAAPTPKQLDEAVDHVRGAVLVALFACNGFDLWMCVVLTSLAGV